jgi:cytochrome c oxidase subunit 2
MDKREKRWLWVLVVVAVTANVITLTPLVPWQRWTLWSNPAPSQRIPVQFEEYEIELPSRPVEVKVGQFVEFVATSQDVTYGFGVFRPDGTMVFQMQVLPGHKNRITWKFDDVGAYDVRSTEYSGPDHSEMFIEQAIQVVP